MKNISALGIGVAGGAVGAPEGGENKF